MAVSKDFFLLHEMSTVLLVQQSKYCGDIGTNNWFHEEVIYNGGKDKFGWTSIILAASLREAYQKLLVVCYFKCWYTFQVTVEIILCHFRSTGAMGVKILFYLLFH